MGREIERKFLVKTTAWESEKPGQKICQGYISSAVERTVRVRIKGEKAFLTIKGVTEGIARLEFEYEIPYADARILLQSICEPPLVEKIRYEQEYRGHRWEIDVFSGANDGLIVAEVELQHADEALELPAWVGREVSGEPQYYNSNLIRHPYCTWKK